ncbi:hypothetical protein K469DRAFT_774218 [Zopfia rhizophila CBS 207.26]|uniref:t-SNARE coiled-coil homology domain-containing protein n=1 Tax=Zopfia rhizophila CBS 207.26 TaxID=1314779 RepID=A0A6A6EUD5_9PEZI|nr:hypothetical protein K469DRAFT_774218 [Zopfia rhizophila CBS 207.26]
MRRLEKRVGILWLMVKPQAWRAEVKPNAPALESRVFFSTTEYAQVPDTAADLFVPLVQQLETQWDHNLEVASRRLAAKRTELLRSKGNNQSVIQDLLSDAELLDLLSRSLQEQVAELRKFVDIYLSGLWSILHEKGSKKAKEEGQSLMVKRKSLNEGCSERLGTLVELSQNLIQLEFNLTSIAEAQKSTSINRSMKRLSWITFVFLPLMFISV